MKRNILFQGVLVISTTSLLVSSFVATKSSAEEVDLYTLCSKFPLNSRCQGYEAPIALAQRSGEQGNCSFKTGETNKSGDCKIVLTDDKITIYLEEGNELEILKNEKATREINIPLRDIVSLSYKKERRTPTSRRVRNFLLFGALGAALTPSDKVAKLDIGYNEQSSQNSSNPNMFTLVVERETGMALRLKLEQSTGVTAIEPEEK